MNKKFSYGIGACLLLSTSIVFAQVKESSACERVILQAMENRTEISIMREKIKAAQAKVMEAKGAFMPSINVFSINQRIQKYDNFSGTTASATFAGQPVTVSVETSTPKYQLNHGIEASYNLYNGGADQARVEEMRAAEKMAIAQYTLATKKIMLEVIEACGNARRSFISYKEAQRNLDTINTELNIYRERLKSGLSSVIAYKEKNLVVEMRAMELNSSKRIFQEAQRKLSHVAGINLDQIGKIILEKEGMFKAGDIERLVNHLGLMENPEKVIAAAEIQSSRARSDQSRAEYKPTVDLFIKHTSVGRSDLNFSDANSGFSREAAAIGMKLKWNIFDGFRTNNRLKQTASVEEQLRLQGEKSRRDLDNISQELRLNIEEIEDQLSLAKKQLELSREKALLAEKRFELHLISGIERDAFQLAINNAEDKIEKLEIDALIARAKYALSEEPY